MDRAAALFKMGELKGGTRSSATTSAITPAAMAGWRGPPRVALTTAGPGIPPDIVRRWDIERRRQAKVIRDLKRASA